MVSVSKSFLAFGLIMALAGCANGWQPGKPTAPPSGTSVTPAGEVVEGPDTISTSSVAPATNGRGTIAPFGASGQNAAYEYLNGYRVGAGDRLTIRVLGQPDLTGEYIVDASGKMSMPLINTVLVAGQNSAQIEQKIAARLRDGFCGILPSRFR